MVGSSPRRQPVLAVLVAVGAMMVGRAVLWPVPWASAEQVESGLEQLQAAALFGAASLGMLSGRWAARTSIGFASAALLVFALVGAVFGTSVGQTGSGPVISTAGAAIAVVLLLAAVAAPEVTDAASLRRLLIREIGPVALLALLALTPVVDAVLAAGVTKPVPFRLLFSALVAAGWFVAGNKVFKLHRPRLGWLPAVLMILAVESVVHAFVGMWAGSLLVAAGLEALAGAIALAGAAMAARAAFVSMADGMTSMLQDLNAMRDQESGRRSQESERLHEVRSVLAGLHAATGSLRKYEDSLDPGVRRRLEDAVGAELDRLNHLVDPAMSDATEELDLEAVVMSVVVAEREQGLVVTTDLADVFVRGRAAEIATLVSDLLENVRVHAPGSAVRLTARVDRGVVTLKVRDWGPGVSASVAQHVFERSYRGARPIATGVPGSGLGLYNARRLARHMNGDLQLRAPAGGGCCFVATLPLARDGDDQALEVLETELATGRSQLVEMSPRHDVWIHPRTDDHDENLPRSC